MNLYLFFGYAVFWSIVFGYLLFLHRRQLQINGTLSELSEARQEDEIGV